MFIESFIVLLAQMKKLSPLTSHPLSCISCTHKIVTFSCAHSFLVNSSGMPGDVMRIYSAPSYAPPPLKQECCSRLLRKVHSYATFWAIRSFPSRYVKYVSVVYCGLTKVGGLGTRLLAHSVLPCSQTLPDRLAPTPSYKNWILCSVSS